MGWPGRTKMSKRTKAATKKMMADYRKYRSAGLAASLALTTAKNNIGERGKN